MHFKNKILNTYLMTVLIICCFISDSYASNPGKLLKKAVVLFNNEKRPLPAEPLIFKAIQVYKEKDDILGLAEAYEVYAYFLQSPSLSADEENYRKYGFEDKTISFDNRYEKALEYWNKSLELFESNNEYADASNVYFNIGKLQYMIFKNRVEACENYSKSIISHKKYIENNPNARVLLDSRFETFEAYIEALKNEVGCREKDGEW